MRLLQGFLFLVMPIGLTLSAAALAVWAWSEGWPLASVLLVSILLLAAAQILIVTGAAVRTSFPGRRYLRDIVQVLSGLKREIAALAGRVDVLEERARQPRRTVEPRLVQPAAEGGEDGAPELSGGPRPGPSAAARERTSVGEPAAPSPAAPVSPRDPLEGFRLYMEPVVDMRGGVTALYRAVPALAGDGGRIYLGRHAGLKATRAGAATAFDMRMLRETADFVRRILEKGHRTPVICPLTKGSLSSPRFREELRAFMDGDRDVASLLVLEISQEMLAGLGASEIEGLAWLAQANVRLALADARPGRVDTDALKALGFAYVDMDAATILAAAESDGGDAVGRIPDAGFVLIASGVDDPRIKIRLGSLAQLARGRVFSPPRRVRSGLSTGKAEGARTDHGGHRTPRAA